MTFRRQTGGLLHHLVIAGSYSSAISAGRIASSLDTAPIVYFDIVPAPGIMGDAIQIELACRILNAVPDGNVEIKFVTSGPPAMQPYRLVEPPQRD